MVSTVVPPPAARAWDSFWKGHVFLFDREIRPPAYGDSAGLRLLLYALLVEAFRILLNATEQPISFRAPLYLSLALLAIHRGARVAWSGVGYRVKQERPTPTELRKAVRTVLDDERYRANARRIAESMRSAPGLPGFAAILDDVVARHRLVRQRVVEAAGARVLVERFDPRIVRQGFWQLGNGLWLVDVATRIETQLASHKDIRDEGTPLWSMDGAKVTSSNWHAIFSRDVHGGEPERVLDGVNAWLCDRSARH